MSDAISDREEYEDLNDLIQSAMEDDDEEEVDRLSDAKAELIQWTADRSIVEEQWGDSDFYMYAALRRNDITEAELLNVIELFDWAEPTAVHVITDSPSFTPKVEAALAAAHPDWKEDLKWEQL